MISVDEDALICDFAETYHIYDYRGLPVQYCATLAVGLRDDSRIKSKMSGLNTTLDIVLNALISDHVATLVWFQTRDGQKGKNRPPSMLSAFERKEKQSEIVGYDTAEDFIRAREKLLKGG